MARIKTAQTQRKAHQAMVKIPLSGFRCIIHYPREKKIICEIDTAEVVRLNDVATLDEIINEARLDYAIGDYKTFTSASDLISELRS